MENLPICTHCGFTWGEYRARGLLGCPHCYAAFGESLQADLLWIHRAFEDAVPAPGNPGDGARARTGPPPPAGGGGEEAPVRAEQVAQWREQIAEALRREDYQEAARLRRLIDGGGPGDRGGRGPEGRA